MSKAPDWRLLQGDVREVLREVPDESIQVVVTSPPYWGLRDYQVPGTVWGGDPECQHEWGPTERGRRKDVRPRGPSRAGRLGTHARATGQNDGGRFCKHCGAWFGSLGLEPTPELYVEHLVFIFREVGRALRTDGTAFVVIGDSYNGSGGSGGDYSAGGLREGQPSYPGRSVSGLKRKDLIGIPWMVAFALRDDGWYLRKDIIWYKEAPMPESPQDRPSSAHEYIFLLAKSARPYWDRAGFQERAVSDHSSGNG
ncbi:MAG: DNA methyltransferase, partial [Candidatus Thermoplasmatota archaeon]|nr:DNA methyltransferase [Candidatus Thermoplasmatota archaeon]